MQRTNTAKKKKRRLRAITLQEEIQKKANIAVEILDK